MYRGLTPIAINRGMDRPDIYIFNEHGILWFGVGLYRKVGDGYVIRPSETYVGYNHNELDINYKSKNIGDIMYTLWIYYGWR